MDKYLKTKLNEFKIYRKKNRKTGRPRITLYGYQRVRSFLIQLYNEFQPFHNISTPHHSQSYKKTFPSPQISMFADGDIGVFWKEERYCILLLISQKFWIKGGFYAERLYDNKSQRFSGTHKELITELLKWL